MRLNRCFLKQSLQTWFYFVSCVFLKMLTMYFLSIYTIRKQCFFTVRVKRFMTYTLLQLNYSLSSSVQAHQFLQEWWWEVQKLKHYHDINTPPGHHLLLFTCSGYRRQLIICHQPSVSLHQVWKKQCLCVCNRIMDRAVAVVYNTRFRPTSGKRWHMQFSSYSSSFLRCVAIEK